MSTVSETTHNGAVAVGAPPAPTADDGLSPSQLAAKYGLTVSGARPGLAEYTRQLWGRRHFINEFAKARTAAQYTQARLGQLWQVMTPLLNAAVYYLIFGVLIGTRKGVDNFIAFLVTGIFIFTFTQSSVMSGVRAVAKQPRADQGTALPACLDADRLHADAAPAADDVDVRAHRHRADDR